MRPAVLNGQCRGRPGGGGPLHWEVSYGLTRLIRVSQLARAVRVAPQLPKGAAVYWSNVQVWPMYPLAIQRVLPLTAVAPSSPQRGRGGFPNAL
jgi:hypothetical protein